MLLIEEILNNPYFQLVVASSGLLGGYAAYQQLIRKKEPIVTNTYNTKYINKSPKESDKEEVHEIKCATIETEENRLSINGKFIEYNDIISLNTDRKYVQEYYGGLFFFIINDFLAKSKENPIIGWVYKWLGIPATISIMLTFIVIFGVKAVGYIFSVEPEWITTIFGIVFLPVILFLAVFLPLMIIRFIYFMYLYKNPRYYYTYCILIKTKLPETFKLWDERKDGEFISSAYEELKKIIFNKNRKKVSISLCAQYSDIKRL